MISLLLLTQTAFCAATETPPQPTAGTNVEMVPDGGMTAKCIDHLAKQSLDKRAATATKILTGQTAPSTESQKSSGCCKGDSTKPQPVVTTTEPIITAETEPVAVVAEEKEEIQQPANIETARPVPQETVRYQPPKKDAIEPDQQATVKTEEPLPPVVEEKGDPSARPAPLNVGPNSELQPKAKTSCFC